MRVLCLALTFLITPIFLQAAVVARVNGTPIDRSEWDRQWEKDKERGYQGSKDEVLERLVLFRLAIQDARRLGLHQTPEVREEQDRALYRAFLEHQLKQSGVRRDPTDAELRQAYEGSPLLRLHHLVLLTRNPAERSQAEKTLTAISQSLQQGTPFTELVLKYSQDPQTRFSGGDLDYVGRHSLSPAFYEVAVKLKVGEVSAPVAMDEGIHLFQRVATKPFAEAPATYLQYLRTEFRKSREDKFLTELFAKLKAQAQIDYPKPQEYHE